MKTFEKELHSLVNLAIIEGEELQLIYVTGCSDKKFLEANKKTKEKADFVLDLYNRMDHCARMLDT